MVAFAEIEARAAESKVVAPATIQWYADNEKIGKDGDTYTCACMVCRQVFKNADPVALIECAEGCRTSHVHDKGVTF